MQLTPRNVAATHIAVWMVCLVVAAGIGRSLFGDGAAFVMFLLQNPQHFVDYDPQRSFASFITQAPVLFGGRIGYVSISTYAALYSIGTFILPAFLFLGSLVVARAQPLLLCATAAAVVLLGFGVNFINSELNLFFSLVWLATVLLALSGTHPLLRGFVLPAIAFALLRVYEGVLLVGPLLALWAVCKSRSTQDVQERFGLSLAALLFLGGAIIGFGGYLSPRDPGNAGNFTGTLFAYLKSPQMLLMVAVAATIPAWLKPGLRGRALLYVISVVLSLLFLVAIIRLSSYDSYGIYYGNRAFLVIGITAAVAILLCVEFLFPKWMAEGVSVRIPVVLLVPFLTVAASDLIGSYRWFRYIDSFCAILHEKPDPAKALDELKRSGAVTGWSWTHPTLSVLLREKGSDAMVLNAPGSIYEPFNPKSPPKLIYTGVCQAFPYRKEQSGSAKD